MFFKIVGHVMVIAGSCATALGAARRAGWVSVNFYNIRDRDTRKVRLGSTSEMSTLSIMTSTCIQQTGVRNQ
jgi:hypothetical protein